jgi:LmbE family N-acetylglucosaminyl deacetylase
MGWIYISPHLDDAILSAGGLIYEQARAGWDVEIWTLFCGFPHDEDLSPIAQKLHSHWGFHSAEETVRIRREEDYRATEIVGAHAVHFDFPDSIYRRGQDGKWLYSNTFAPPHADDAELSARIISAMFERLDHDDKIVCPLAIGGHVDHVITRHSVEAIVLNAIEELGVSLWFYADIPYLLNNPSALDPIEKTMQAESWMVASKGLIAWQNGIAEYASQIPLEFESHRKMRKAISKYGRKGIRLWHFP